MTPNLPPGVDARRIEAGLAELRQAKRKLLLQLGREPDELRREITRRKITDVEAAIFAVERVLHPANGDPQ